MKKDLKHIFRRAVRIIDNQYDIKRYLRKHTIPEIETLVMETSSYCNLKCELCNFHGQENLLQKEHRQSFLTWDITKKIAEQASKIKTLKKIVCYHSGEEFLNPEWYEMLDYILRRVHIEYVTISTNGMLLNKDNVNKINKLYCQNIQLNISLSGHSREECERFRAGIDYKVLKDNINNACKEAKPYVKLMITADCMLNEKDIIKDKYILKSTTCRIPQYIEDDFPEIDKTCSVTFLYNPHIAVALDSDRYKAVKVRQYKSSCINIFNVICIDSQGFVLNCPCNSGYQRLGNILEKDMNEIWMKDIGLTAARENFRKSFESPEFCCNCGYQSAGGYFYIMVRTGEEEYKVW